MKIVLLLLLTLVLFIDMVSGTVLNLTLIVFKVTGQIALTRSMVWGLYTLATLIVTVLLWLFIKLGGQK